jgi:catechol 2,3-dioxygenase-like lactoylglutathione lyase family enzyme
MQPVQPTQPRISLITLGVADAGRARAFYEALGWRGESPDGDVVFFQSGTMIFALWSRAKLAEDSAVHDSGGWGGVTLAHNVSSPEQVDAILHQAEKAGAAIGRPAGSTFYGGYSGVFIDPDGHPWEVAHNPGWVLDDQGGVHLH